jgi:Fic family protein
VDKLLLQQKGVSDRPTSDILETLQHEQAFRSLAARKTEPIKLVVVQELHESVFRGVTGRDAGQWRRINVRIGGTRHRPPSMEKVVPEMDRWIAEYERRDLGAEETFALAAWMHHRFESIHPFRDGNGRVGRLLLNLHFLKRNWAPVHLGPPDRKDYVQALQAGHEEDFAPLIHLLQTAMAASFLDLLDQVGTARDTLAPLGSLSRKSGYTGHYMALRALQGQLPAVKEGGRWRGSRRAVELYMEHVGR